MAANLTAIAPGQPSAQERATLILVELDRLPTLPAAAAQLLALTASDESSIQQVVSLIESDASLTAAILRMVSRASLGVPSSGMTIARAVTLLGYAAVRNAVLSVEIFETLRAPADQHRAVAVRREMWKHNLAVACLAEGIAETGRRSAAAGNAFVCGLLHDIGKIALDARFPKSYARVVERVDRDRQCICDAEREVYGLDHTVAARRLLTRWGLPGVVVDCAWLHHQPPDSLPASVPHQAMIRCVQAADLLARRHRLGFSGYRDDVDGDAALAALGVGPESVTRLIEQLPQRMGPYCALIDMDDDEARNLYARSVVDANRELGRLNRDLLEANARLDVRSRFFTALGQLAGVPVDQAEPADICAAAAAGVRQMLNADQAIAFTVDRSYQCLHVGLAGFPNTNHVVELHGESNGDLLHAISALGADRACVRACAAADDIWHRCTGSLPAAPLWLVPLNSGEDFSAGLLFALDEAALARFLPAQEEWRSLAAAIRQPLEAVRARAQVEQMNQELLDLHRRLQATQRDLVRARSVAMVAQMAAGAAHEINTPLTVISGRAQLLLQNSTDPEQQRALATVVEQVRTASHIVTDLMAFAKPAPPRPQCQQLSQCLEAHCQRWRQQFHLGDAELRLTLTDAFATVYADAGQLADILDALVQNAVEASHASRPQILINSPSRASDETVRLVVEDRGAGMSPEVREHAFDPFFSHRPAGRGRGLGLSRAYRLAEINGGALWLESTLHEGTRVTLELPARAPQS